MRKFSLTQHWVLWIYTSQWLSIKFNIVSMSSYIELLCIMGGLEWKFNTPFVCIMHIKVKYLRSLRVFGSNISRKEVHSRCGNFSMPRWCNLNLMIQYLNLHFNFVKYNLYKYNLAFMMNYKLCGISKVSRIYKGNTFAVCFRSLWLVRSTS